MKVFENILSSNSAGIDELRKKWESDHAKEIRDSFNKSEDGKTYFFKPENSLIINKKFFDDYPSFCFFSEANNVTIDNVDTENMSRWPQTINGNLYIIGWKTGMIEYNPIVKGEIFIIDCNRLSTLTTSSFNVLNAKGIHIRKCGKLSSLENLNNISNIDIDDCPSITSLEGLPESINGNLEITNCDNLTSLKGCPKIIKGNFIVSRNINLTNLDYMPEKVGGIVSFRKNGREFTKDEITARCKAKVK